MSINERLKEVREGLKLSQKSISEALGVKQSYYSEVENGKRKVTARIIDSLIVKFGVSPDWLMTGNGVSNISKSYKSMTGLDDVKHGETSEYLNTSLIADTSTNIENDYVNLSSSELNDMIRYKLRYMDFYLVGTLFNLRSCNEISKGVKFDNNSFKQEKAYLQQFEPDLDKDKPAIFISMSAQDKLKLLRDLDEATKIYLDKIWVLARDLNLSASTDKRRSQEGI